MQLPPSVETPRPDQIPSQPEQTRAIRAKKNLLLSDGQIVEFLLGGLNLRQVLKDQPDR
jgi:hypothetical protein